MSVLKEFKEFAVKGNVIDLAVGVIIGAAFGKIVASMVSDIIMPPIGMILGRVDFEDLKFILQKSSEKDIIKGLKKVTEIVPEVSINYGSFIQKVIEFIIVAFCVFFVVKGINHLKRKKEEAPAPPIAPEPPTREEILLAEIRDLLKK